MYGIETGGSSKNGAHGGGSLNGVASAAAKTMTGNVCGG